MRAPAPASLTLMGLGCMLLLCVPPGLGRRDSQLRLLDRSRDVRCNLEVRRPENRAGLGLSGECPGVRGPCLTQARKPSPDSPEGPYQSTSAAWALEGRTQPAGEGHQA